MISTLAALRTSISSCQQGLLYKQTGTLTRRYGKILDLFTVTGFPGAGTNSSTLAGAILNSATTGALSFSSAASGSNLYIANNISSSVVATTEFSSGNILPSNETVVVHVFDRVWHNGGILATTTTRQSWTPPALTRYTTGEGLSLWYLQQSSGSGTTTANYTLEYTNQAGSSSSVVITLRHGTDGISSPGDIFPLGLNSADTGIRALNASTCSTSTGSGTYGFFIAKYLGFFISTPNSIAKSATSFLQSMPNINDNACITFAVQNATTGTTTLGDHRYTLSCSLNIIQG